MSLYYRNFLLALPVLCFFAACQPLDTVSDKTSKAAPEPAVIPNRELPEIVVHQERVILTEEELKSEPPGSASILEIVRLRLRNSLGEQFEEVIANDPEISAKLAEAFYTRLCDQDVLVVAVAIADTHRRPPYGTRYIHFIFESMSLKRLQVVTSYEHEWETGKQVRTYKPMQASLKAGTNQFCPELLEMRNVSDARKWLLSLPAAVEAAEAQSFAPAATNAANGLIDDRYRDNGDGTVTDIQTNLTWMRCIQALHEWTGSACMRVDRKTRWAMTWVEAQSAIKNVSFAGYSDWRLPTADELDTLVQCPAGREPSERPDGRFVRQASGRCHGDDLITPKINRHAFPDTPRQRFFSSTLRPREKTGFSTDSVFIVDFSDGQVLPSSMPEQPARPSTNQLAGVRLVRGEVAQP